jgi:hypothetical protein
MNKGRALPNLFHVSRGILPRSILFFLRFRYFRFFFPFVKFMFNAAL